MALQISIFLKDKASKGIKGVGKSVLKTSKNLLKLGVASAAVFGGLALKQASDFEKQLAEIATLMDDMTDHQIKDMGEEISKLSIITGQNLAALTKSRYDIVSTGFADAASSAMILEAAVKLAVGGVTTAAKAGSVLTAVLKAYGLAAEDATFASDILFTTVRLGRTTIEELSGSIGQVLPLANAAKLSLEGLGAAIGVTTVIMGNTARSMVGIRATLKALIAPADEAAMAMKRDGIEIKRFDDGMLDLLSTMQQFTGMDPETLMQYVPDQRAITPVLALANNIEDLRKNLEEFQDITGTSQTAYALMLNQFATKTAILKQNLNKIFTDIGSEFIDILTPKIDLLNKILGRIGIDIGWANIAKAIVGNFSLILTAAADVAKVGGELMANQLAKGFSSTWKAAFRATEKDIAIAIESNAKRVISFYTDGFKEGTKVFERMMKRAAKKLGITYDEAVAISKKSLDEIQSNTEQSGSAIIASATTVKQILVKLYEDIYAAAQGEEEPLSEDMTDWLEKLKAKLQENRTALNDWRKDYVDNLNKAAQAGELSAEKIGGPFKKLGTIIKEAVAGINDSMADWMEGNSVLLDNITKTLGLAQNVVSSYLNYKASEIENQKNTEINAAEETAQAKIDAINESSMTEKKKDIEIAKIKEELSDREDEIRKNSVKSAKDQARKMKPLMIAQAIMGAAMAVINAMQTVPFIPMGLIAAGLAATAGVIEVATISKQTFALGGTVLPMADNVPVSLTAGEKVSSRASSDLNGDEIDRMNQEAEGGFGSSRGAVNHFHMKVMDMRSTLDFLRRNPKALIEGINNALALGFKIKKGT